MVLKREERKRRLAAIKTADAVNAIEGSEISDFAKQLSERWARGEISDGEMKDELLAYHRQIAEDLNTLITDTKGGIGHGDIKTVP